MPYIRQSRREQLDAGKPPIDPGELNYVIHKVALKYLFGTGSPNYAQYNAVMGVLECVKAELYRRLISEYEDGKKELNGDVY